MPHFGHGLDNKLPWEIIQPAIDPFAQINQEMSDEEVKKIVQDSGGSGKPMIVEVSRLDP